MEAPPVPIAIDKLVSGRANAERGGDDGPTFTTPTDEAKDEGQAEGSAMFRGGLACGRRLLAE